MKQDNPAKVFLRRYKAICGRVDALQRAIDEAMARAVNTGITLKEIKVLSSPAEHDPMARDICNAVDACSYLYEEKAKAEQELRSLVHNERLVRLEQLLRRHALRKGNAECVAGNDIFVHIFHKTFKDRNFYPYFCTRPKSSKNFWSVPSRDEMPWGCHAVTGD